MARRPLVLVCALLALVLPATHAAAQHEHGHHPPPASQRLGTVHFANSCAPEVGPDFDRAVALLHSFWFDAAVTAFEGVAARDPGCGMAYWGVALSRWGNPLGGMRSPERLRAGLADIEKGLAAGAKTPRERDYVAAVAELYRGFDTRDHRTRTVAYEQAMGALANTYPDDTEAAIFYAIALNGTQLPTDKTYANLLKAATILEPIFEEQPDHPGVTHYLIHSYDAPPLARRGLAAAHRYARIAPDAPHALHMPSHIFTRVGSWEDSVASNLASARVARETDSPFDEIHALDYQVYAYLQMARDEEAREIVRQAADFAGRVPAMGAYAGAGAFAVAAIPARYALERGDWAEAAGLTVRPSAMAHADAMTHFARAVGAARSGRPADASADVERLAALRDALTAKHEAYWAEQVDLQRVAAEAWVAFAQGRRDDAVTRLRETADREDATEKSPVTPGPLAPAREQLGELLLALDRPADALAAFEATLEKEPNRFRAVAGAAEAAQRAGDAQRARQYSSQLVEICKSAKGSRPELDRARAYVARSQH
jgi:tetratricopeptide (TPR) repeat protein